VAALDAQPDARRFFDSLDAASRSFIAFTRQKARFDPSDIFSHGSPSRSSCSFCEIPETHMREQH
jgi:hypothetical protein